MQSGHITKWYSTKVDWLTDCLTDYKVKFGQNELMNTNITWHRVSVGQEHTALNGDLST